ncbi:hypothetical protein NQ318_009700, partial [Aromia moschata]
MRVRSPYYVHYVKGTGLYLATKILWVEIMRLELQTSGITDFFKLCLKKGIRNEYKLFRYIRMYVVGIIPEDVQLDVLLAGGDQDRLRICRGPYGHTRIWGPRWNRIYRPYGAPVRSRALGPMFPYSKDDTGGDNYHATTRQ